MTCRAAEANGVLVILHTGTTIFPDARNKCGDPIYVDDDGRFSKAENPGS
jgi:predicted TIM-barrel fold metal-dependent hydrolase